jgi:hypothetical protein
MGMGVSGQLKMMGLQANAMASWAWWVVPQLDDKTGLPKISRNSSKMGAVGNWAQAMKTA